MMIRKDLGDRTVPLATSGSAIRPAGAPIRTRSGRTRRLPPIIAVVGGYGQPGSDDINVGPS